MTNIACPECAAPLILKQGKHGTFYGCSRWRWTGCTGTHSAHQGSGKPMGVPAKQEVKAARHKAHTAFDALWMTGQMSRKRAYEWMQKIMNLTKRDSHIAKFDLAQCERLITEIHRLRKKRPPE
jgi:uncharacterized Zn finger protein (UPF0148 family)